MLNKIDLIGRLTRDPEYRALADGTSVCNFTIAVDDDYKDKDGGKVTDFIDCTAWRQAAEFVTRYLRKGALVAVSGRLKSRKWTDKDDNKRTSWFVKCDNAYSLEARKEGNHAAQGSGAAAPSQENPYRETEALIDRYRTQQPPDNYAVLTDDDAKLPF